MSNITVYEAIFLRLIFDSFEPYPYPIIFTLKIYQSVTLKVVHLISVSNLFKSGLLLKSVPDFDHPKHLIFEE